MSAEGSQNKTGSLHLGRHFSVRTLAQTVIKFAQILSAFGFADNDVMLQSEIEKLLEVPSHRVREWVSNLEPLASKPRTERAPTHYSAQEVLFLAVVWILQDAGITWKQLVPISEALFNLLRVPRQVGKGDVLILWKTLQGWEFRGKPDPANVHVLVPVHVARELVRKKLDDQILWVQTELNLGVTAVRGSPRTRR